MSPKQQRTVEILSRLDGRRLDVRTAGEMLGVGERQVYRLQASYRREGLAAVVHGNQGRTPRNRTDPALVERIVALAGPGGKYQDLNTCHLQDLLEREEQIVIGRSTLDRLLKASGVRPKSKRGRPIHRRRRPRRLAEGMLVQIDGSPFAWLEERGPKGVLMGAVDDATGKIVSLLFRPTEDQIGYLLLLRSIAQRYGLPMSIYHDRHTILRSPKQPTVEEQLAGQAPMSQIQRVMADLGIESIPAYSPQAKGRIERLWGILQDRLTKELRLAGISTLEAADAWLPGFIEGYNRQFAKVPADPIDAWVPLAADFDTSYHFASRQTRVVTEDHCISYQGHKLQLLPDAQTPNLANQRVAVHVVPEGDIHLYLGKLPVRHQPVVPTQAAPPAPAPTPSTAKQPKPAAAARRRAWLYGHP